ncbi:MAG: metal ABC transporter permease, partial [Wujia sp.]
ILAFLFFYNKIFAVTFDEGFAKAIGAKADMYNLLIAIIIAVIIVLGMNLVGSLLISALIIFPALAAMSLLQSFRGVVICSGIVSVICAMLGMLTSIVFSTPVGSTIVMFDLLVFVICYLLGRIVRG